MASRTPDVAFKLRQARRRTADELAATSEFYDERSAMIRRLIEEHGFTTVAVEADVLDGSRPK